MDSGVKRIAAIHDLAGFGRCSLTVIMPTLSAMGFQVCPLPTAVLSTHTSEFTDFHFHDLTKDMAAIIAHWQRLDIDFAAVYSGFLGSEEQADLIGKFIKDFRRPDQLVLVDPVLGDEGKLYPTISAAMIGQMRNLVKNADLITPNPTEAALLLGEKPQSSVLSLAQLKEQAQGLAILGPDLVAITGALTNTGEQKVNLLYEARNKRCWLSKTRSIPTYFPGTGDIFAALLCGGLLSGDSPALALSRATAFLEKTIKASHSYEYPSREGVVLEKFLANGCLRENNIGFELLNE